MSVLAERLLAVHAALAQAHVPHAFGGAIALAYCTDEPRGTRDIDVNVFLGSNHAREVLAALPAGVRVTDADVRRVERDDQVRMWWDDTPLDLFFDAHDFHGRAKASVREVPFEGRTIPILGCTELVVFKALYNRTRDWAAIEAIVEAQAADLEDALTWVRRILGPEHAASVRLAGLLPD